MFCELMPFYKDLFLNVYFNLLGEKKKKVPLGEFTLQLDSI